VRSYDFAVIGAGIAGASVAYELQQRGSVLLLEREALPGQHTTGRSAAFLVESYGNAVVQRLTRASRTFFEAPPEGFADCPLVKPRPSLWIARPDQRLRLAAQAKDAIEAGVNLQQVDGEEARRLCPALREGYAASGVVEPDAKSIDVAALLAGFLRAFRASGGRVVTGAPVTGLRRDGSSWEISSPEERYRAGIVINAAGAWADQVGRLAGARGIGLQPLRRTAITFDPPNGANVQDWACLIDADEDFYLKPEGAQLLASPCDETPSEPCDASADDLGVALAADRIQRATTLQLRTIRRRWAGLRSFVADRSPVIGMDSECEAFCWLAGQGGFGIMTSPAAARAAAGLVVEDRLPPDLAELGLLPQHLSPTRLPIRPSKRPELR
jgi:D-arginine dehydrogenase